VPSIWGCLSYPPWLQQNLSTYLNIFLLFVGLWIFTRTLTQEGIIQCPKAGSFITTVLVIIGAVFINFSLFCFFSNSWQESFLPHPFLVPYPGKGLVLVITLLRA
jgi:hypothetical protein